MKRHYRALAALAFLAAACGCSMCQSPFDYCNAVTGPDGGPNCNFGARRGSIFVPMDDSAGSTPMGPTPAEMPGEQPPQSSGASPAAAAYEAGASEADAVDTLVR
jgi:hypothetical protein